MPKSFRLTAWDCRQILTKKFSDQQVRMVVEFDGRLDESRLVRRERDALVVNLDHTAGDAASVRSLTYLFPKVHMKLIDL